MGSLRGLIVDTLIMLIGQAPKMPVTSIVVASTDVPMDRDGSARTAELPMPSTPPPAKKRGGSSTSEM